MLRSATRALAQIKGLNESTNERRRCWRCRKRTRKSKRSKKTRARRARRANNLNEIRVTLVDHVVNHGLTLRKTGQSVQPKLSWKAVANIIHFKMRIGKSALLLITVTYNDIQNKTLCLLYCRIANVCYHKGIMIPLFHVQVSHKKVVMHCEYHIH